MARVFLKNVTKRFGKVVAVDHVTLEVRDKEFMVLLGPSGCGKTTTLRLIAGLEDPDEGEIWIGERLVNEIDPVERNVAMVFQSYALYPHMTVFQNIEFPLKMARVPKEERKRKVIEVARFLGIENLLNRYPKQLSGGQQQRVALARAIVREPEVFLLDEPLSNLDAKLRVKMRFELRKLLHEKLGITTIYVTHDQVEAMTMADRIAVMNEGKVMQVGTPIEVFEKPANMFVAGFIGVPPMNFMEGTLVEKENKLYLDIGEVSIEIPSVYKEPLSKYVGKSIVLGVRPQDIIVSTKPMEGYYKGRIVGYEPLGTETYIHFTVGRLTDYVAVVKGNIQLELGGIIYWTPRPDKLYFFDKNTGKAIT
ncbi:ABC transporter ATP-binding protein [Desulfurococcaceae archaeon MEX13E-LK6-19]|nr:ABC transporter ATP-binding protein [Desulfurococcaceae archaeon MEX13E-LK6-19]